MGNLLPLNQSKETNTNESSLQKKWGKKVIDYGYSAIPSILIKGQRRLGLTPQQLNVILHLVDFWWTNEKLPFPSKKKLADRIGMSTRNIQKIMKQLEDAGYVKRVSRKTFHGDFDTNIYDLTGLVDKIKSIEPEFTKAKNDKKRIQDYTETPKGRRKANG